MMVLVDTSVWIDHFHSNNDHLCKMLSQGRVLTHPFVLGELACGNLTQRSKILQYLKDLPAATMAANEEVLAFVEKVPLYGRGLGWVDVHLLASARLSKVPIWTFDKAMAREASILGVGF